MDDLPEGLSRREFLVTTGLVSAGTLVSSEAAAAAGTVGIAPARILGPGEVPVRLLVNGTEHRIRVEPRTTLAEALRDRLGLTGTKIGCDRGACGACTVWLGEHHETAPACLTLALDVAGLGGPGDAPPRPITTIEGLAATAIHRGALHPVQQAFIDHDALQCGFCTPGMIMSCAALVERHAGAGAALTPLTEEDVRAAIAGNLCRCGTYPHVIAATLQAAGTGAKGKGGKP